MCELPAGAPEIRLWRALARALKDVERVDEMDLGVTSLERRQSAARELWRPCGE